MSDVRYKVPTVRTSTCNATHRFLLLNLRPHWIWLRPELAVNRLGQISYEGSDWHGRAVYSPNTHPQQWSMTFHSHANTKKMRTFLFESVENTDTFLCIDSEIMFLGLIVPQQIRDWITVSEWAALDDTVVACAYCAPGRSIMQTAFSLVHLGLLAIIRRGRPQDSINMKALVGCMFSSDWFVLFVSSDGGPFTKSGPWL